MLVHQTSAIERIVEAIKGYFSIVGLMLAGLYLLHSPFRSTRLLTWLSYAGGLTAVLCGTVICVWYSVFLLRALLIPDDFHKHSRTKKALFWGLLALAAVILVSIIIGAITMTCDIALS
jgi:vacuolar-type H+-ATPase subunit I/STV1